MRIKKNRSSLLGSGNTSGNEIKQIQNILEIDYDFYFKNNHGLFVMQTLIQNEIFKEINKNSNIREMMLSDPNISNLRNQIIRQDLYRTQKTLVFDV